MTTRPTVGVDIDGVLGNQVDGVLRRVNARLGLTLGYDDIVHWNMPLGDTSFVPEIGAAMKDPKYIVEMPVHDGASELLASLRDRYYVKIITVRPLDVLALTEEWLARNDLCYDELVPAQEALKSRHAADALIDDYVGNLVEFLDNAAGVGILVDQPWNQDVSALTPWLESPRLIRVARLRDIPALLDDALA